jgi:hypothetical protein
LLGIISACELNSSNALFRLFLELAVSTDDPFFAIFQPAGRFPLLRRSRMACPILLCAWSSLNSQYSFESLSCLIKRTPLSFVFEGMSYRSHNTRSIAFLRGFDVPL